MPKVENRITLGNVLIFLQLCVFLIAGGSVWSQAQAELKQARDDIQDHETRLRTIEARVLSGLASIDGRLANLEGKTP